MIYYIILKFNVNLRKELALLAIMVVDIQREYRFYTEKKKNAFKKHGHTPEIRRNRPQGTLNAKSPGGGIGLVWMTSGFGPGYGF